MDLQDEITIAAPRQRVYDALNDADVLRDCIPGCEELTKISDTELTAVVRLKIGPVKARFNGDVVLDPGEAPAAFSLTGAGNGGVAGFAKGGAKVALEETGPDETVLRYAAHAEVGGKLAQLGNRLVASTAKKLSAQFFEAFKARVEES